MVVTGLNFVHHHQHLLHRSDEFLGLLSNKFKALTSWWHQRL